MQYHHSIHPTTGVVRSSTSPDSRQWLAWLLTSWLADSLTFPNVNEWLAVMFGLVIYRQQTAIKQNTEHPSVTNQTKVDNYSDELEDAEHKVSAIKVRPVLRWICLTSHPALPTPSVERLPGCISTTHMKLLCFRRVASNDSLGELISNFSKLCSFGIDINSEVPDKPPVALSLKTLSFAIIWLHTFTLMRVHSFDFLPIYQRVCVVTTFSTERAL